MAAKTKDERAVKRAKEQIAKLQREGKTPPPDVLSQASKTITRSRKPTVVTPQGLGRRCPRSLPIVIERAGGGQ